MKPFEETKAAECRWSEYAGELVPAVLGWRVVWDGSAWGYSGKVKLVAVNTVSGKWRTIDYAFGSCPTCDGFSRLPPSEIREEMRGCSMWFDNAQQVLALLTAIQGDEDDDLTPHFRAAIPAVEAYLNQGSEVLT